jgi:hypothetical protein
MAHRLSGNHHKGALGRDDSTLMKTIIALVALTLTAQHAVDCNASSLRDFFSPLFNAGPIPTHPQPAIGVPPKQSGS